jgi:4-amino-4-deoxy-L-arabinose transferase-like glycosyltransferase
MLERLTNIPRSFVTPNGDALSLPAYLFLFLICVAFFTPGIASLPPTDRDESSFAQATKQMIETGNYVDIRLQDKPRYKKPIGIYWLQAASVHLFDPHHLNEIWAYRIPSFLGATTAVLMTAVLGSLLFGPMAGLLAALMMAGCVMLNVEARLAKTDAALLGSILLAQYALARAYIRKDANWGMAVLFWTALGAGILIKGPIILLVVLSTLLWLRISDKNLGWFKRLKPVAGFFYLLLLVVPWFVAIVMQSKGAFVAQSAGQDLFAKLWQGQDRGIMPPGLHLLAFPIFFFPFAFLSVLAIPDTIKNRHEAAIRFCLGWLVPTWIVFEVSLTKLPHYTLPTYPAIAMLTAKALIDGYPVLAEKARGWALALAVSIYLMIGTGFAVVFALLPVITDHQWDVPQIIAGIILIIAQGAALLLLVRKQTTSVLVLAIGSLVFMLTTFGSTVPGLQHLWLSRAITQTATIIKPCENSQIVSAGYGEPSLVFLAGTHTLITSSGAEAAQVLQGDACHIALIDSKRKQDFLSVFESGNLKPVAISEIQGINSGHERPDILTLYIMPPKSVVP